MTQELKKPKKDKVIFFRLTAEQEKLIRAKAERYADGNLSAWIAHAAANFVPKKK